MSQASIFVLVYGQIVTPVKTATSAKGSDYARVMIRAGDGDEAFFVTAMIFDEDSIVAVDRLAKGDAVAVSGQLRVAPYLKDGVERIGYTIYNARALTAAKPKPNQRQQ